MAVSGFIIIALIVSAVPPSTVFASSVTFTEHSLGVVGWGRIQAMIIDDLDEDGDNDIICGDPLGYDLFWYRNNGTGSFTKVDIDTDAPRDPYSLAINDVDGDGDRDILASMGNTGTNSVVWYANNGSEIFTRYVVDASTTNGSLGCDIADLDSDGDMDLLAGDYGAGAIRWYDNNGSESFTERSVYSGWGAPSDIEVVDIDADSDMDVVSVTNNWNDVGLFRNNGSESFSLETIDSSLSAVVSMDCADIDGDGDTDIVSGARSGGAVRWYDNNGSGSFTQKSVGSAGYVQDIIAVSLDGDGGKDIVVTTYSSNTVLWFDNDGNETFTQKSVGSISYAQPLSVGDLDGDNAIDIAAASVNNEGASWFESSGADTTNPSVSTLSPADNATSVATTANLVITFDETVDAEAGADNDITIKKASDDSTIETIDAQNAKVSGAGTTQITINPATTLSEQTAYYVQIGADAFDDASGNSYGGISNTTSWNFTTAGGGGGGASSALPAAIGSGSNDKSIDMDQKANIGKVDNIGVNVLAHLYSQALFHTIVSKNYHDENHTIKITGFDQIHKTIRLMIESNPKNIILALKETVSIDLDDDGISDILVKFEDALSERIELTVRSLLNNPDSRTNPHPTPSIVKKYKFARDLRYRMKGDDVKALQVYLNQKGFPIAAKGQGSPGQETTYYGRGTKAVMIKFQRANNIKPISGTCGVRTRAYIVKSVRSLSPYHYTPNPGSTPVHLQLHSPCRHQAPSAD